MDLDGSLLSHYHFDARILGSYEAIQHDKGNIKGVLADPPYNELFAMSYRVGPGVLPSGDIIIKHSLAILPVGGRVGILSMGWPRYPKVTARQIAIIGVLVGNGNIGRWFAVYEKTA